LSTTKKSTTKRFLEGLNWWTT